MRFDTPRVAASALVLLAGACASNPPANRATAEPDAPLAPATPAAMPTLPPHLAPRADGTYVDQRGNVLTPPPVMLGVTMEQPGPSLVAHMGVNPARTSLLVDVIPGLPADKAGLQDHDLVIAVDGSDDASPHNIRARLRKMKPGDTITLTVRRGPVSKTVTLSAEAWKAEHMVRPIHAGSFNRPGLGQDADSDPAPRELAPIVARLERIEQQLQQLNRQVNAQTAPPAAPATPVNAPAKPAPAARPAPAPAPR
jgi:hypothetical protein